MHSIQIPSSFLRVTGLASCSGLAPSKTTSYFQLWCPFTLQLLIFASFDFSVGFGISPCIYLSSFTFWTLWSLVSHLFFFCIIWKLPVPWYGYYLAICSCSFHCRNPFLKLIFHWRTISHVDWTIAIVRATPKSNSVDNMRALQGDATVLEKAIKLWWERDNNRTLVDEGGSSHYRWWES